MLRLHLSGSNFKDMGQMEETFQSYVLSKLETNYLTISEFMDDAYYYRIFSSIIEFGLGHLWGDYFESLFVIIPNLTLDAVRIMFEPTFQTFWEERCLASSFACHLCAISS